MLTSGKTKMAGLEPTTFGVLVWDMTPEPKTDALAIAPHFQASLFYHSGDLEGSVRAGV
jgi:hypothetical protein